jgi:hypothetical protein
MNGTLRFRDVNWKIEKAVQNGDRKIKKRNPKHLSKNGKIFRKAWMTIPMVKFTKVMSSSHHRMCESKGYEVEGYPFQKIEAKQTIV